VSLPNAPWLDGLDLRQAEHLIDWLQANGYPPVEVRITLHGVRLRCPGFRISRDARGELQVRALNLPS
jgi:hypothetical protein